MATALKAHVSVAICTYRCLNLASDYPWRSAPISYTSSPRAVCLAASSQQFTQSLVDHSHDALGYNR